jgi:glyoxylase I family protein
LLPFSSRGSWLRHLAFAVEDIEDAGHALSKQGVEVESIRVDPFTDKKFGCPRFFEALLHSGQ